jgi:hypothetical protein
MSLGCTGSGATHAVWPPQFGSPPVPVEELATSVLVVVDVSSSLPQDATKTQAHRRMYRIDR